MYPNQCFVPQNDRYRGYSRKYRKLWGYVMGRRYKGNSLLEYRRETEDWNYGRNIWWWREEDMMGTMICSVGPTQRMSVCTAASTVPSSALAHGMNVSILTERMNEWMNGWMDGWMNEWIKLCKLEWTRRTSDMHDKTQWHIEGITKLIGGLMDGWMDGNQDLPATNQPKWSEKKRMMRKRFYRELLANFKCL